MVTAAARVHVSGCPMETTKEDIRQAFPGATRVIMVRHNGQFSGNFQVHFASPAEAEVATESTVVIKGQTVDLHLCGSKEQQLAAQHTRTVVVNGCPLTVTEEEVRKAFRGCTSVIMAQHKGRFTGTCFILYPTEDQAKAAAGQAGLQLGGQDVFLQIRAGSREEVFADWRKKTVAVEGCPQSVTIEEVRQAFPGCTSVTMAHHEGRFTGTCLIVYPTEDLAKAAAGRTGLQLGGQDVFVQMRAGTKEEQFMDQQKRTLVVRGCPPVLTKEEAQQAFPGCTTVTMGQRAGQFSGTCFVLYPTVADAKAAYERGSVQLGGKRVWPEIHKGADKQLPTPTVMTVSSCPSETTKEDIRQAFPRATRVIMVHLKGKFSGKSHVHFATLAEARAAASSTVVIKGTTVHLAIPGLKKKRQNDEGRPAKRAKV